MAILTDSSSSGVAVALPNGTVENGDIRSSDGGTTKLKGVDKKKTREAERRRRRRKQKKNNKKENSAQDGGEESDDGINEEDMKENTGQQKVVERVEVEYIPDKADIEDYFFEDFKKIFEKFTFNDASVGTEIGANKEDDDKTNASKKKTDSDSDEEQESEQKEKGISNKKKKLQRRMNIAELKQICSRPDVVEVWDATAADPKLLVFLKSYRNTVPVPRHWSQKRKFLQGTSCL